MTLVHPGTVSQKTGLKHGERSTTNDKIYPENQGKDDSWPNSPKMKIGFILPK